MSNTIAHRPHVHHTPRTFTVLMVVAAVVIAAVALTYSASQTGTETPIAMSTVAPPVTGLALPADQYDVARHETELQRSWTLAAGRPAGGAAAASRPGASVSAADRRDTPRLEKLLRLQAKKPL
jgi:hypothetical protein